MTVLTAGFQGTVSWVFQHGYTLLFLLMLIEGPVVTAAGAFAAVFHYFNGWIVLILSIIANLIPDGIYYALGYWGRNKLVDKYGHYFGLTKDRIQMAEKLASRHSGKSLFAIKVIPLLATPGLIFVGATKMKISEYAFWCTVITLPTSLIYFILGYYFGAAYSTIDHYLHIGAYLLIGVVAVFALILYFQKSLLERFEQKMKESLKD